MDSQSPYIPPFNELMWPTLQVVQSLGGSARIDEISEGVIEREGFTEEQQQVMRRPDDHMTMIDYRLAWARNYLKNIGALQNSERGVWATTEKGRELQEHEIPDLVREYKREYYRQRKLTQEAEEIPVDEESQEDEDWTEVLLDKLLEMEPSAFERLTQRLLREAGFRNVEVLGRSGDGGLDGVGVYRVSLVSFPVYFQCKRYKGAVGPEKVRDFRGAMQGRGDKGLLITTGNFTAEAKREATRDGAPPIDLIDGERLCDLLKEHELGVETRSRVIEEIRIQPEFFSDLS